MSSMSVFFKKYIVLIPLLVCLLFSQKNEAQEVKQDTLSIINNYQIEASNAIINQDFESAITSLYKAYKLADSSNNNNLKASIHLSFAELQYSIHNYNKASSETIKSLTHLDNTEDEFLLGKIYYQNGLIFTQIQKFNEAEKFLKDADNIFNKLNTEKQQAQTVLAFGILELERGNPLVSLNYFEASLPLFISQKLYYQEALTYIKKSEALLEIDETENSDNLNLAKNNLEKALSIIDANTYTKLKIESYKLSSKISIRENKNAESEYFLNLYTSQKDSIFNIYINAISNSANSIMDNEDLYEIIANQQSELQKKQKSINFGKMTTGLSIALIIILSLLALSLFKNNNLRAKANNLLKDKNVELTLSKEKAEKASLAKAQFLSTVTHELRTPLYAVTGLTHLLLEEDP